MDEMYAEADITIRTSVTPITLTVPDGQQFVMNIGDTLIEHPDGTYEVLRNGK